VKHAGLGYIELELAATKLRAKRRVWIPKLGDRYVLNLDSLEVLAQKVIGLGQRAAGNPARSSPTVT